MYSVDFTVGFIENTCFIIHVGIMGRSEETGAMGMESKWVLFVAKKRSAASMLSRFIVRTTFVYEAKGNSGVLISSRFSLYKYGGKNANRKCR
jgi:hypothetical protein